MMKYLRELNRYIWWYEAGMSRGFSDERKIYKFLLDQLPYEILVDSVEHSPPELIEIENSITYKWSAYLNNDGEIIHYFFETEEDAMAFKLRWL